MYTLFDSKNKTPSTPSKTTDFNRVIKSFRDVLQKRNLSSAQALWNKNSFLHSWYMGKLINFGTDSKPDLRTISMPTIIADFKLALAHPCNEISTFIWDNNPLLNSWYGGAIVTDIDVTKPLDAIITFQEIISCFKSTLINKNTYLINKLWNATKHLTSWYNGEFFSLDKKLQRISCNQFLKDFKLVLESKCSPVAIKLWQSHVIPYQWYKAKPVDFGTAAHSDIRVISINERITIFRLLLAVNCNDAVNKLWDQHISLLRLFYGGKFVKRPLSPNELITDFKYAINGGYTNIIKEMWEANPLLHDWLKGKSLNMGNKQAPEWHTISFNDVLHVFNSILHFKNDKQSLAIWNGNTLLQEWYRGELVNRAIEPACDLSSVSSMELLKYYHLALKSENTETALAMRVENKLLASILKTPGIERSKTSIAESDRSKVSSNTTAFLFSFPSLIDIPAQIIDESKKCRVASTLT